MMGATTDPAQKAEDVSKKKASAGDSLLGESRVMLRWTSSLWKLLWRDLLAYTTLYLIVSIIYRFALNPEQMDQFTKLIKWLKEQNAGVPLTFILGFYVSMVVTRWWNQYNLLPWPDSLAIQLRGHLPGPDEEPRMIRRTVIRYCLLSYILCIKRMSSRLRKRFPNMHVLIKKGWLSPDEAARIEVDGKEEDQEMYKSNWWKPIQWCTEILSDAHMKKLTVSPPSYNGLTGQVAAFRHSLTQVATYGHIPVPLVYTQVVTLAVYVYFVVSLVGEQWIVAKPSQETGVGLDGKNSAGLIGKNVSDPDHVDLYYPFFLTFKFLFYFGWLRVAEALYNPFGEDDDDFELNDLFNRHFKVAMDIVDQTEDPPELKKDIFWIKGVKELDDYPPWDETYVGNMLEKGVVHKIGSQVESRDPML